MSLKQAVVRRLARMKAKPGLRIVRRRLVTANVAGDLSPNEARHVINAAAEGADFLVTQEMQRREAKEFCPPGYGVVQGKLGSRGRCAIFFRKDRQRLVKWAVILLHVSKLYPSATRHFVWARFLDLETRRYWNIGDVHLGPHADNERGGITRMPRGRLVRRAIARLVAWARTLLHGQDALGGDFNIDGDRDLDHHDPHALMESLARVGFVSSIELGGKTLDTHGRNDYDQWFLRLTPGLARLIQVETLPRVAPGQDHHPYAVDVDVVCR